MKVITSLQNQMVKDAVSLHQKKYRDELGVFLVEGETPCREAILRGWECVTLFVQEGTPPLSNSLPQGERGQENAMNTPSPPAGEGWGEGASHLRVTPEILQKISKKENPQPVIGVFKQQIFDTPASADFYLALEEIRDPGNLGTIMRTAHAVNVKNIILIGQCCDPFNPEVIRASMGSFSFIHLSQMTQDGFLTWQTQNNLNLIGTNVGEATDYRKADYNNAVLVMGNEQKGLSPALKSHCTSNVKIPMPGGTESLNLAIATGLLLYQATKN